MYIYIYDPYSPYSSMPTSPEIRCDGQLDLFNMLAFQKVSPTLIMYCNSKSYGRIFQMSKYITVCHAMSLGWLFIFETFQNIIIPTSYSKPKVKTSLSWVGDIYKNNIPLKIFKFVFFLTFFFCFMCNLIHFLCHCVIAYHTAILINYRCNQKTVPTGI